MNGSCFSLSLVYEWGGGFGDSSRTSVPKIMASYAPGHTNDGAFLFSFVYVMYLNIDSYLYGKQIKSKMGNKLYLRMIFICVRLNLLDLQDCHTMSLKFPNDLRIIFSTPKSISSYKGNKSPRRKIP